MIQFIKICGGLACTCTVNHIEQNNNNKWISTAIVNNKMIPSWGNDSLLGKWFHLGEFSLPIRSETHIHYVCMFVSLFLHLCLPIVRVFVSPFVFSVYTLHFYVFILLNKVTQFKIIKLSPNISHGAIVSSEFKLSFIIFSDRI